MLGEIPDRAVALAELRRVVRPGGWLVVGELFGDPHWISPRRLQADAAAASFTLQRRSGTGLAYFARFG